MLEPGRRSGPLGTIKVDLLFVLDVTGSMGPYIDTVKAQISAITTKMEEALHERFSKQAAAFSVHFGGLAFRDMRDAPSDRISQLPITADKDAMAVWLSRLHAHGGGDMAEDIVGALKAAADQGGWRPSRSGGGGSGGDDANGCNRYAILFTDAPCHGLAPPGVTDDFSSLDGAAGIRDAMAQLRQARVELMVAEANHEHMALMLDVMRDEYLPLDSSKTAKKSREDALTVAQLGTGASEQQCHFIFVLDESGSMDGQPWNDLHAAFNGFVHARRSVHQGAGNDIVSAILFDHDVDSRSFSAPRSIHDASVQLPSELSGGGTAFGPVFPHLTTAVRYGHAGTKQVIIWMSDGAASDNASANSAMSIFAASHRNVSLHTIIFGNDAQGRVGMQDLARHGNGKFHLALRPEDLSSTFAKIGDNEAQALIQPVLQQLADRLGKMIAERIMIDHS